MAASSNDFNDNSELSAAKPHLSGADSCDVYRSKYIVEEVGVSHGGVEPLSSSMGSSGTTDFGFQAFETRDADSEDDARIPRRGVCRSSLRDERRDPAPSPHRARIDSDPPAWQRGPAWQYQEVGVSDDPSARSADRPSALRPASADAPPAAACRTPSDEVRYAAALRRLADSMKRSRATRLRLMMQRDSLGPEERLALRLAKEMLNLRQHVYVLAEQSDLDLGESDN